jgi:hypothetical protein
VACASRFKKPLEKKRRLAKEMFPQMKEQDRFWIKPDVVTLPTTRSFYSRKRPSAAPAAMSATSHEPTFGWHRLLPSRGFRRHARHLSGINLARSGTYEAHVDDHWRS